MAKAWTSMAEFAVSGQAWQVAMAKEWQSVHQALAETVPKAAWESVHQGLAETMPKAWTTSLAKACNVPELPATPLAQVLLVGGLPLLIIGLLIPKQT